MTLGLNYTDHQMTENDYYQMKLQDVAVIHCHQMIQEKLKKAEKLSESYTKKNNSICSTSLALVLLQYEERIKELEERIQYLENQS